MQNIILIAKIAESVEKKSWHIWYRSYKGIKYNKCFAKV